LRFQFQESWGIPPGILPKKRNSFPYFYFFNGPKKGIPAKGTWFLQKIRFLSYRLAKT
jgi:hypothetical protein